MPNPSFFPCVLLIACSALLQVNSEILCTGSTSSDTITLTAPMTFQRTTMTAQTDCQKNFQVKLSNGNAFSTPQALYLIIEVWFTNMPNDPAYLPYLIADEKSTQLTVDLKSGTLKPSAAWSDSNGLVNRKNYHHITIKPEELKVLTSLNFAIIKAYSDSNHPYTKDFNYDIRIMTSANYLCPSDCTNSNHGTCNTKTNQCDCLKGFFDEDCSVTANEAVLKTSAQKTVGPNSWGYFFFNIGDFNSDLKISLQKDKALVDFSFLINEKGDNTIPNGAVSTGKYELTASQTQGYLLVQEDNITPRKNDILLIGVYNNDDNADVTAQVLLEVYDDSSVLRTVSIYLLIGISLALLLVWLALSGLKYKNHTHMEALIRVYQVEREEEKTLSKKDINKYFPKEKFKDLKTSFCQTMCSVCLEDFEPETNCRKLYCEHIYHADCIEAWLKQHYDCPNCKKEMTRVAIEEHVKEKGNKEENTNVFHEEKKETREQTNHNTHHRHHESGSNNIVGINAQRVHVQKQRDEENRDGNGMNLEQPEQHNVHKRREMQSHTGTGTVVRQESNLQVAASHEEGKNRHLVRGAQGANQSSVQDGSSRSEISSRAQNIRKANRRGQGTVNQGNNETELNALRLDL